MVTKFVPSLVIIRENALDYPLGEKIYHHFNLKETEINTEVKIAASRGKLPLDYDLPFQKKFHRAKSIMLVSVRSVNKFQTCKPSAHYQLPLVSGCPGHCHYCYLCTNLGKNPYVKTYVNLSEILDRTKKYIEERKPDKTVFEGAATSDPLPTEKYTGALAKTINFFAREKHGRFRFVSKFETVDSLLDIEHNNSTEIRFSLNSKKIIAKHEPGTPPPEARIEAAKKVSQAGYQTGFLLAPIIIYKNYRQDYKKLIEKIKEEFPTGKNISLEIITHRYTERAKNIINQAYPDHDLPMEDEKRQFKYGQFGYGKYLYPKEEREKLKEFLSQIIEEQLPAAEIKYFV